jgi:hypothetical protein
LIAVRIDARARAEIDREAAWYDERGAGLKERFVGEIEHSLGAIATLPTAFPVIVRETKSD